MIYLSNRAQDSKPRMLPEFVVSFATRIRGEKYGHHRSFQFQLSPFFHQRRTSRDLVVLNRRGDFR